MESDLEHFLTYLEVLVLYSGISILSFILLFLYILEGNIAVLLHNTDSTAACYFSDKDFTFKQHVCL